MTKAQRVLQMIENVMDDIGDFGHVVKKAAGRAADAADYRIVHRSSLEDLVKKSAGVGAVAGGVAGLGVGGLGGIALGRLSKRNKKN